MVFDLGQARFYDGVYYLLGGLVAFVRLVEGHVGGGVDDDARLGVAAVDLLLG